MHNAIVIIIAVLISMATGYFITDPFIAILNGVFWGCIGILFLN